VSGPGEGERLVSGPRVAFVKGDLPDISVFEFHLDGPGFADDLRRMSD
jgi:hypothetical protein